jgi:hypothetical protein
VFASTDGHGRRTIPDVVPALHLGRSCAPKIAFAGRYHYGIVTTAAASGDRNLT